MENKIKNYFVRHKKKGITLTDFLKSFDPFLASSIKNALEEFESDSKEKSSDVVVRRVQGGDLSLWYTDSNNLKKNIVLYQSSLDLSYKIEEGTITNSQNQELVAYVQYGRPGEQNPVSAADFIKNKYNGEIRDQLLNLLSEALKGLSKDNESIVFCKKGVTLKVLSKNTQVRKYDAQEFFEWH